MELYRRAADSWEDLADYFQFDEAGRRRLPQGHEVRAIWEWLKRREREAELVDALVAVGRDDLLDLAREIIEESLRAPDRTPAVPGLFNIREIQIVAVFAGALSEYESLFRDLVDAINLQARTLSAGYRLAPIDWGDARVNRSSRQPSHRHGRDREAPRIVLFLLGQQLDSGTESKLQTAIAGGSNHVCVIVVDDSDGESSQDSEKLDGIRANSKHDVQWLTSNGSDERAVIVSMTSTLVGIVMMVADQFSGGSGAYSELRN